MNTEEIRLYLPHALVARIDAARALEPGSPSREDFITHYLRLLLESYQEEPGNNPG